MEKVSLAFTFVIAGFILGFALCFVYFRPQAPDGDYQGLTDQQRSAQEQNQRIGDRARELARDLTGLEDGLERLADGTLELNSIADTGDRLILELIASLAADEN